MVTIPIKRKQSGGFLWPLLGLLALVLLVVWLMRGCNNPTGTAVAPADSTATAPSGTVAGGVWDADFGFVQGANGLVLKGKVASEAAKTALLDQLRGIYPGVTINADSLLVDASATTTGFMDRAGSLFGFLSQVRNAGLGLAGQNVTVRGDVRSRADLDAVAADLTGALPTGYTLANEITVVAPPPEVAAADSLIKAALIQPIPFATGTATLGEGASVILDKVAGVLTTYPNVKVTVEGHTDNTGNAAANQRLSEQRAQAVMRYLVDKGIAADRMTAVGYGQTRPVADNATEDGRAQNRRVVFGTN